MRILLRFLFVSLLLILVVALGTEVAALHHRAQPSAGLAVAPVVVRKSLMVPAPRRSVHAVRHRAGL